MLEGKRINYIKKGISSSHLDKIEEKIAEEQHIEKVINKPGKRVGLDIKEDLPTSKIKYFAKDKEIGTKDEQEFKTDEIIKNELDDFIKINRLETADEEDELFEKEMELEKYKEECEKIKNIIKINQETLDDYKNRASENEYLKLVEDFDTNKYENKLIYLGKEMREIETEIKEIKR